MTYDPVNRVHYSFESAGDDDLIVDVRLEPGGGLPAHLHPRQTETWSVIEGQVRFRLGDQERVIGPEAGDMVVSPGVVHGLASATGEDARLRCLVSPALHLQQFLEESAAAAHEGLFTARGLPRGMRGAKWVARFLKRHGDETVFISPPRFVQRALIAALARGA